MSDYGTPVLRFWVIRPSECDGNVSALDGRSMCHAADRAIHHRLTARQRRVAHDHADGPRWLPWTWRTLWSDVAWMLSWRRGHVSRA